MSNLRVDSLDSDSGYVAFSGGLDSSEATSGLGFARGTTAQRPTGTNGGEVRLNDETKYLEQNTGSNSFSDNNLWFDSSNHTNQIVKGGLMVHYDARATGVGTWPIQEVDSTSATEAFNKDIHNDILGNWQVYSQSSYSNYFTVNSQLSNATPNGKSVTLKNNSTNWIGSYYSNVKRRGRYILEWEYYADSNSSTLVLDNDGIVNNSFNRTYTAGTAVKRARRTVNINTTGEIRHFFRRTGGGNITIRNIRMYQDVFADLSGNANHGGIYGGPSITTGPNSVYAVYFDGSDDYISFSNTFWTNRDSGSIGIWFAPTSGSLSSQRQLVEFGSTGDFCIVDGGELRCHPQASYWGDTSSTIAGDAWNYAVLVQANHGWRTVYINGVDAGLTNSGNNPPYAANWAIGSVSRIFHAGNYRNYFQGHFGGFHAYDRELSQEEVLHNYNVQKSLYGL